LSMLLWPEADGAVQRLMFAIFKSLVQRRGAGSSKRQLVDAKLGLPDRRLGSKVSVRAAARSTTLEV
jgi:hypothetical protein